MGDPRLYPQGNALYDVAKTGVPIVSDLLSAFRGATSQLFFSITALITLLRTELIGALTGVKFTAETITTTGAAIADSSNLVLLNKSTGVLASTIAAPIPGKILIITQIDAGTSGHTVTLASGTWDGTNDKATFDANSETLTLVGVSATRYNILSNVGGVTFS